MKKVILMPDSFKGTITSAEACEIMRDCIARQYPDAEIIPVPVADGGEGSVDCFLQAVGGRAVKATVKGPLFQNMAAQYAVLADGTTAVVEMASCAGLPLMGDDLRPGETTTFGVGQQLCAAANQKGITKIIVGLGGSATNDGGCGAAAAAGVRFYNNEGGEFVPTGSTLKDIARIDASGLQPSLKNCEIIAMCDIDNPMYGESGAAYVFGPQKGADKAMVEKLDEGLRHLCAVIQRDLGQDLSALPGGGAAGAMGAGMKAFFGAQLQMGIETVLDTVQFDKLAADADMVLSGEGKIDTQSLRGKVVIGVARRTKALGVPLFAIVGDVGDEIEPEVYDLGVTAIYSINNVAVDFKYARNRSKKDMRFTVSNLMRGLNALGL